MKTKRSLLTSVLCVLMLVFSVFAFTACGDCEHEWGEWSVSSPSTCAAQGTKQRKCSKCDEVQTESIDIADHEYDTENLVWTWNGYESATATLSCITDSTHTRQINANVNDKVTTAPTCTATGTKTYTATVKIDGVTYTATKNETLAALGHTEVKDAAVAATCKQVGLTEGSHCSVCNEVLVAQQELSKTNHTEETLSAVTASCSTEGLTEGKKCSVCNEILVAQVSLEKLPHTETVLNAVAPSCSEEGLTEGKKCSVCNEILVAQNPVDKIAHTEETVVGTAPTCSSTGLSDGKKCSVCKEILAAQTILPKTACDYESVITDPTCEAQGYTTHTCSTCGDSYIDSYKSALGHAWGSWKANAVSTKTIRACTNNCGEHQEIISVTAECIGDYYRLIGENVSSDDIVLYALINDEEGSIIEIGDFTLENTAMTLDGENKVIVKYYTMTTIASVVAIHDNLPNTTSSTEFTWSFDENNNCYNLTGFTGNSTNVVIPAHINRVPVRNINSRAFEGNQNIVSLTIPASVQSIGEYAFSGCSGLKALTLNEGLKTINGGAFVGCPITSLVIPDSVTYMGTAYYEQGAFRDCSKLVSVTIGDGLKNIPNRAFLNCTALKTLVIGDGVETISEYAFCGCISLESVTFGANLLTIGNNVFENCESMVSIDIPGSVQTIGENAFAGCTGLVTLTLNEGLKTINGGAFMGCPIKTLVIPDSVKTIGTAYYQRGAFKDCTKLTSITIGDGLKSIPEHSFANCTALKTLIIGDGVESIGTYAFGGCVSLESVTFGANLLTIGNNAFENCESIVSIDIPGSVQTIGENVFAGCTGLVTLTLNEGLKTINGGAFMGCPIKTLVIPDSVKTIGTAYYQRGAFKDCTKLTSITIGDGLKSIPEHSFANCTALKTLIIGNAVESIGEYAFGNCTSLNSITFGENLITIGNYAFQNCESLESVEIPSTVQTIGEGAFIECSALATLKLNEGLKTIYGGAFMGCPLVTLTLPNSVKSIETAYYQKGAFKDCTKLTSVTIGDGMISISEHSFANCTALKTLVLGDAVESIGEYAFGNCTALNSITFGDSLITIGNYAFQNCESLTSIDIPGTVQTIGEGAFIECSALATLKLNEGLKTIYGGAFMGCPIKTLVIPNSVKTLETAYYQKGAFRDCTQLESVTIGSGLQYISDHSFTNCTALKTVVIGNAVETIGEGAFSNCSALTNVQLGNGLITIANYAFENCTALTTITIPDSVQNIGEHAFKGCALLVNFNIGIGVQRIGAYALQDCISLKSVAIPANVQVIGAGLFTNCSSLEEVIIEKGVLREVGNDVFNGCSNFDRMYYTGTASDWVLVAVSEDNSYPLNVSPYYYSLSSPSGKGNYWYYNGNGEIRVWNVSETSFKAEEYSEKFANSTFGSSNTSYSSQFLSQLEGDSLFQARILIWEALHIATDSSWESKAISKKDVYKMVIYDLLVGEADAQVNPLAGMDAACNSYVYDFAKFLLGKDSLTKAELDQLKNLSPLDYDYVEMVDKYFKGIDVLKEVFEMSTNLYDALYVAAQYKALSDMDTNFYLVLTEISNDGSLPWDLRNAASECADCYRTATDALLKKIVVQEFASSIMEVLWKDFQDEAWKAVLGSVFPQVKFADLTIKGAMFLANMGFNLDACNEAYYQLEAAVGLENALRNVIKNTLPDYLRYNYKDKSEYYMYAIDMYQTSVLLGFDYSNNLLREHSKSADVNAEEKQAYENMMAQIRGMKQEKATMYNNFESVIEQLYVAYYS